MASFLGFKFNPFFSYPPTIPKGPWQVWQDLRSKSHEAPEVPPQAETEALKYDIRKVERALRSKISERFQSDF